MTLYKWSKTAASNDTADSTVDWQEGQSPASVNNSARAMMAANAKWRDDISGTITTGGTSTAYTLTSNQVFTTLALMNGAIVSFIPHTTCGATVTLNVDSLGAKPLRLAPAVELAAGNLVAGTIYTATYVNSSAVWYLTGVYSIAAAASSITTAMLQDDSVTYAKIQNVTNARLLGNFSGGTADVSEYSLGAGLTVATTVLSGTLPVQSSFRNLSIKVATNTTVTVAADFVCMYDGTSTRTAAISATCNLGTASAVNALDTGSIAIDTWYYIFAISNGTTDGTLASTSATSPTMPSGYTFKARIGAVQTWHTSAQLYGTWQFGNKAQYIVGLANGTPNQTTTPGPIASGTVGTFSAASPTLVATSVAANGKYVPPTASVITVGAATLFNASGLNGNIQVAPSQSYSGTNNGPNGTNKLTYPIYFSSVEGHTAQADILLESTSISVASSGTGVVYVVGWVDNL